MKKSDKITFTFIAEFRGGTYCSQICSTSLQNAMDAWIQQLKKDKAEIKYLGNKVIGEISCKLNDPDCLPTKIDRLRNVWFTMFTTKMGTLIVNIIRTDMNELNPIENKCINDN